MTSIRKMSGRALSEGRQYKNMVGALAETFRRALSRVEDEIPQPETGYHLSGHGEGVSIILEALRGSRAGHTCKGPLSRVRTGFWCPYPVLRTARNGTTKSAAYNFSNLQAPFCSSGLSNYSLIIHSS
jgi:hypothetical protein